jgi:hypothetical protein
VFGVMTGDAGVLRKIPYILSDFRRRFVTGIVEFILAILIRMIRSGEMSGLASDLSGRDSN